MVYVNCLLLLLRLLILPYKQSLHFNYTPTTTSSFSLSLFSNWRSAFLFRSWNPFKGFVYCSVSYKTRTSLEWSSVLINRWMAGNNFNKILRVQKRVACSLSLSLGHLVTLWKIEINAGYKIIKVSTIENHPRRRRSLPVRDIHVTAHLTVVLSMATSYDCLPRAHISLNYTCLVTMMTCANERE